MAITFYILIFYIRVEFQGRAKKSVDTRHTHVILIVLIIAIIIILLVTIISIIIITDKKW